MNCDHKVLGCSNGNLDLCFRVGSDFSEEITWVKEVGGKTIAVNTLGFNVKMQVISGHNSKNEIVLELDKNNYLNFSSKGIIKVSISKAIIDNFSWSKGRYTISVSNLSGITETILTGKVLVKSIGSSCC
jgi:hypothetical protein